jgi:acyl-CoA reductase-like NAD-dependent aldehyde dehydrogenase
MERLREEQEMKDVKLLIGGKQVDAGNGATVDRIDPFTGEVASRAPAATPEDADRAVAAAQAAFPAWRALNATKRRKLLLRAADLMDQAAPRFIEIGVAETGGTPMWYGFNVMLSANMLREAAAMTTQITGDIMPSDVPGSLAMGVRAPVGVVLGIAPWNAPVILGTRALAMPLACGNTVILKAAESCPGVHALIGEVLQEAGLGDGVVNVVTNAPKDAPAIVERLIANPAVRRVNFTGSTHVGRIVAQLSAKHLKPALLELGGKAPFLVLHDADLDEAAAGANFGAFMNQGQICMSTERIIVDRKVADSFVEKLAAKASKLVAGDPRRQDVQLGTLVSAEAAGRIKALVDDAVSKGARLACGGQVEGAVMQPTVVDGVTPAMKLYAEESFGPVVAVIRAADDEDAIRIANDSPFGLSSAVFSQDIPRALDIAARIEAGICHVNGPTVHDEANMPFGGVKDSGYGRFGSKASIAEFTDLRWVTLQKTHRHYPI